MWQASIVEMKAETTLFLVPKVSVANGGEFKQLTIHLPDIFLAHPLSLLYLTLVYFHLQV